MTDQKQAGQPKRLNGIAYVDSIMQMEGGDKPSEHGRIFGAALASVADEMAKQHPDLPPRCSTCAFRSGTGPNQMAGTLMAALKCVTGIDPDDFACHHSMNDECWPTRLCVGYVLARMATPKQIADALMPAVEAMKP
jgi:hypothetical protein